MAAHGNWNLANGNTLTLVEQPVLRSGEREVRWEVLERDTTGQVVQRRRYDSKIPALAWIEGVI